MQQIWCQKNDYSRHFWKVSRVVVLLTPHLQLPLWRSKFDQSSNLNEPLENTSASNTEGLNDDLRFVKTSPQTDQSLSLTLITVWLIWFYNIWNLLDARCGVDVYATWVVTTMRSTRNPIDNCGARARSRWARNRYPLDHLPLVEVFGVLFGWCLLPDRHL